MPSAMNFPLPRKDWLTIISLVFLLLAIPLTVILIKEQIEFRKRAAVSRNGEIAIYGNLADPEQTTTTDVTLVRTAPLNPLSHSFLPIVSKNFRGYSSGFVVQNPGEEEVEVTVRLFPQGSGDSINLNPQKVSPHGRFGFYLPNYTEVPDNFLGSAVLVESLGRTMMVVATHNRDVADSSGQKIAGSAGSYPGQGSLEPAPAYYLPSVVKDYYGFSSSITVQNAGGSPTRARLTIFEERLDTSPIELITEEIPSGSMRVLYLPSIPEIPATPNDETRFVGSAVVESLANQPLVVAVTEASRPEEGRESGEMIGVYLATPRDSYLSQTRLYFPAVTKNYYGFTTGLRLQNIDEAPTRVRGTAYPLWGGAAIELGEFAVEPNRAVGVYFGNLANLPEGFLGSAVFESLDGQRIFGRAARSKSYQQAYVEEFDDLDDWTRAPNFNRSGIVADHFIEAQGRLKLDASSSSTFPTFYQENFFPDGSWRLEYDLTYEDVEGYGDGVVISSQPFPPNYERDLCGGVHDRYLPAADILQAWQGGTGEIQKFRLTFMGESQFFGDPNQAGVRYDVSLEYNSATDQYTAGLKRTVAGVVQNVDIPNPTRPSGGKKAATILLGNSYNQNESIPGTVCPGASNGAGSWSRMTIDKITLSPSPRGQTADVVLGSYEAHYNRFLAGSPAKQTAAYLPSVIKNYSGWVSSLLVQNTGTGPTRLKLTFNPAGVAGISEVQTAPIAASSAYFLYLPDLEILPDNYLGNVVIESLDGESIVAVANQARFYKDDRGEIVGEALGTYNSWWFTQTQARLANSTDERCQSLDDAAWGDFPEVGTFTGPWTLTDGEGLKYVCTQFIKSDGRFGAKIHDTIELVADAPPTVSVLPPGGESRTTVEDNGTTGSSAVTLEWTAADDHTPAEELRFCYKLDATDLDPQNCGPYETVAPSEWVAEFSNLSQGDHVFYVWAKDNADQVGGPAPWNFRVVLVLGIRVDLQPDEEWVLVNDTEELVATVYDTKGTADQTDDTVLGINEVGFQWLFGLNASNPATGSVLENHPSGGEDKRIFRAGSTVGDADAQVRVALNVDPTMVATDRSYFHVVDRISCDLFPAEDFVFTLGEPAKSLNVTLTPPGSDFYIFVWQSQRRQVLAGNFADGLGGRGNPLTTAAQAVNWTPSADAVEGDVFDISVTATDDKTGSTCNGAVRATIAVEAAYGVEILDGNEEPPTSLESVTLIVGQVQENIRARAFRVVSGVKENIADAGVDLFVWSEDAADGGAGHIRYQAPRNIDQLVDFVAQRRGEERIYVVAKITPPVGVQVTTDADSLLIKVYDPLSCEGGINPDAATAFLGDEVSFEANPSGGSGAYTIEWSSTFNDAFSPERAFRNPAGEAGDLVNPLVDGGDTVTWVAPAVGGIDLNLLPRTYDIKATVKDSLLTNLRSCEMTATVMLNKQQANLLLRFKFQARLPGVINDPLTTKFEHNKVRVIGLDLVKAENPVIYDQTHSAASSGPQGQVALVLGTDSLEFGREYQFYLRGPQHVRNQATQKLILRSSVSNYTLDFGTLPVGDFGPLDNKGRDNQIIALDDTNWNSEVDKNMRTVELNQQLDTFGDTNLDLILNALDYSFYSHNVAKEVKGVACPLCPDERRVN